MSNGNRQPATPGVIPFVLVAFVLFLVAFGVDKVTGEHAIAIVLAGGGGICILIALILMFY